MTESEPIKNKPEEGSSRFLWWRIGEDELREQVEGYDSLKFFESARGISVLFILLAILVTVIFVLVGYASTDAYFDVIIFAILGFFIALGHRWAMLVMMGVWTLEKAYPVIIAIQTDTNTGTVVIQFFWWAFYMHTFYLAFKVEQNRLRNKKAVPLKAITRDLPLELEQLAELKDKGLITQRDFNAKKKKILGL